MVHCFQNIWYNKKTHPNERRNGYWLSTKWDLASYQSSVQVVACAANQEVVVCGRVVCRKGCVLIRQLANCLIVVKWQLWSVLCS